MRLVQAVEAEIGHPVEAWPTQILPADIRIRPPLIIRSESIREDIRFLHRP